MSQVQRLLPAAVFCVWGRSGCGGGWEGKIHVKVSPKGASPVGTSWDIPHIEVRLAVFVVNLRSKRGSLAHLSLWQSTRVLPDDYFARLTALGCPRANSLDSATARTFLYSVMGGELIHRSGQYTPLTRATNTGYAVSLAQGRRIQGVFTPPSQ